MMLTVSHILEQLAPMMVRKTFGGRIYVNIWKILRFSSVAERFTFLFQPSE